MFKTTTLDDPTQSFQALNQMNFKLVASTTHKKASCCPSSAILPKHITVIASSGLVALNYMFPANQVLELST
jgi:hypothetical protein